MEAKEPIGYVVQPINGGRKRRVRYNRLKPRPSLDGAVPESDKPDTTQDHQDRPDASQAIVLPPPPTLIGILQTRYRRREPHPATPTAPSAEDTSPFEEVAPTAPTTDETPHSQDLRDEQARESATTSAEQTQEITVNQRPRRDTQRPARFENFVTDRQNAGDNQRTSLN